MGTKDQQKLLSAGFTIIRADDQPAIRIKYKKADQTEWKTLLNFSTKAARDREMQKMLESNLVIND